MFESCTRFSAWGHDQQDCFFLLSIGRRRVVKPVRDLTLIRECFLLHCACLCLEQLTYQLIKTRDAVVRRQLLRQGCEAYGLITFLCSRWLVFAVFKFSSCINCAPCTLFLVFINMLVMNIVFICSCRYSVLERFHICPFVSNKNEEWEGTE